MATYYGYAERNAEDQIDWNAVGKSMSDTLNAEQKRRDDLKAQIDKDSFEYGQTLSNSPQGEHKGMNEYSINYAADAQDYNLMQLRLLKSGKIKLRDYLKGRENIKQGTTQIFDMMKNYQEKYGEYAERAKTGVSGMYEAFLLGEVEGFGNLTSTMPYINPTTGKVSIGKKVPQDPSKPYNANTNPYTVKMSDNPSDFRTVQELAFALSSQVDRFDSAGAIDGIVDNFAKKYQTLIKSGSSSTNIDDVRNMPDFKNSLNDMIIAEFESNPLNALSAMGDFIKYGPDGELIKITRNPAEQNDHTLLLVPNPEQPEGGIAMPDFDSESGQKLLKHMREKIAESVDAGLNRTIEYQRGFQPRPPSKSQTDARISKEKVKNLSSMWRDLGTETDPAKKKSLADAVIMAANQGKKQGDDKVMEIIFNDDSTMTFVHSDPSNNLTTSPITDDAKSWMEAGTEVFGVLADKDIQQLLGKTTTINTEGFDGLKAGREGFAEYTETPTQAYSRNVIEQNPEVFSIEKLVVNGERQTTKNVNAMLSAIGLSSKYTADYEIGITGTDEVEVKDNKDNTVVAKINLDDKDENAFNSFLNTVAELGAKEVDERGENELLLETRSYRKKKSKKKTPAEETSTTNTPAP